MAADQKPPVIPGVPLAALDAITDPNTRDVLRALIDGWHTRNGATGTGDNRFVTAAEVGLVKGRSGGGGFGNVQTPSSGATAGITPGMVSKIINDLQAQILESKLFKYLGERIDLIDKPGGLFSRIGNTEIAIQNEITQRTTADTAEVTARQALGARVGTTESGLLDEKTFRTNSDNALAQAVNTMWAAVGNNLGLVQTGTQIVANPAGTVATNWNQVQAAVKDSGGNIISSAAIKQTADATATIAGQVSAQWAVKTDVGGYVAGFGLATSANNSTPLSEFYVRADRFAIGSPSVPRVQNPDGSYQPAPVANIPFIVIPTATNINGQAVPAGVYISDAFIANGTITNAMIGHAEIGTLLLGGNAVTVPLSVSAIGITYGAGVDNWLTVASGTITLDYPGMVFAASTGYIGYGSGWVMARSRLLINGQIVSAGEGDSAWVNAAHSGGRLCQAGQVTVELIFAAQDIRGHIHNPSLFIQAAKR